MLRKNVGRLFVVVAGGGCLVVLIFVVLPLMNQQGPRMTQDEIVAEVLGSDDGDYAGSDQEVAGTDGVTGRPPPLVGVWNDGREGAVVFPAVESEDEEMGALPEEHVAAGVPAQEVAAEESGLPRILSEQDVAEARAALEAEGSGPGGAVEPDSAGESEKDAAGAVESSEAVLAASGEEMVAAVAAPPAGEPRIRVAAAADEGEVNDGRVGGESETVVSAPEDEAVVKQLEAVVRALVRALELEREGAGVDARQPTAERQAVRRGEFDLPVSLNSRVPLEVSHPSGRVPAFAAAEAAQAGKGQPGLPPRTGVIVPGTLRGVMGYRLPLVSRQEVPDQIVSGVLIPAHTTFVVLKAGAWELVDVSPEELQRLQDAELRRETPAAEVEPVRSRWNPMRIFRKRGSPAEE